MKLFKFSSALGFASLFSALASATITIEDLPSAVRVDRRYDVKYSSDRDYQIKKFLVMHWDDSESSVKPVGGIVDHFIKMDAGDTTTSWKVPAVKDGMFELFLSAVELDSNGEPSTNPNATFYANSNNFEIYGGPKIYPKELAIIIGATLGGLVLLIAVWVVGARIWRKRRSAAVRLPGGGEGGYRDDVDR